MNKTESLQFTPGKFYRTRDGRKAQVTATGLKMRSGSSIIAVMELDGYDSVRTFMDDGRFNVGIETPTDLIAEWIDKPEVDWSKMPEGANYVTVDEDGTGDAWEDEPRLRGDIWVGSTGDCWKLYPQHTPKLTCNFRDSLVERPKGGL